FTGGKDGAYPIAGLTLDKNGNLFGTTLQGGSTCDCGVVFELAATENFWRFSIIHSFHGADGASPSYGKLVFDGHGSLYGATQMGGSGGVGAVFRMIPRQTGWQETVIYNLSGDTVYPYGVIMVDGRLYGTSVGGSGQVSVFKLSPVKQGPWIYKQIFTFVDEESGSHLSSGVIADPLGNLYGTIPQGGANGMGLVYQLVPQGHEWVENVLHEFDYSDGASPNSLVFDSMGNLFGEAMDGGPAEKCPQPGCGVIFELGPGYSFSRLYSFDGTDGSDPQGGLIIDGDGKLYGTTAGGGAGNLGTVFRVRR
ncbi:MAG TPA: choice-of-anchor tandem repeat GloVer-containing protein, partial [Terriglobales bacterium]